MPESSEGTEDIEAHEILAQKVIDALRGEDEKRALEDGAIDLNAINKTNLTALLEPQFPDQAADIANQVVDLRNSQEFMGIIQDPSQLEPSGPCWACWSISASASSMPMVWPPL